MSNQLYIFVISKTLDQSEIHNFCIFLGLVPEAVVVGASVGSVSRELV